MQKGFFRKHAMALRHTHQLVDILIIGLAALLAYYVRFDHLVLSIGAANSLLFSLLTAFIIFPAVKMYEPRRGHSVWEEVISVLSGLIVVMFVVVLIGYMNKSGSSVSRVWMTLWFTFSLIALLSSRYVARRMFRYYRKKGYNRRTAVIYGAGELGKKIQKKLAEEKWVGMDVLAFYDDDVQKHGESVGEADVLGGLDSLFERMHDCNGVSGNGEQSGRIDQIWIALPLRSERRIKEILTALENTSANIHLALDSFGTTLVARELDSFAGMPVANFSVTPAVGLEGLLKLFMDKFFSITALLLFSPIMLIIAILIKLESKGPVIYKQRRYGLVGEEIEVWKFRSMTCCENGNEFRQATKNDVRVTKVGKFIRSTSLDELPQFFNVLQGRMSVVGPRPHPVALDVQFNKEIPKYMLRFMVKPGITGWAQVNGARGETETKAKMEKRIQYDLEYLTQWSLWLDIRILFMTLYKGFRNHAAY